MLSKLSHLLHLKKIIIQTINHIFFHILCLSPFIKTLSPKPNFLPNKALIPILSPPSSSPPHLPYAVNLNFGSDLPILPYVR